MQKQPLDELLKTYKIKLKLGLIALDESDSDTVKIHLRIQIALYRTFIHELQEVIES